MPKKVWIYIGVLLLSIGVFWGHLLYQSQQPKQTESSVKENSFWLILKRASNQEILYQGVPGDPSNSQIIKEFQVKTGIPGQRPTPLPEKLGREYWLLTSKLDTKENTETAPYFITLNIPYTDNEPYGPEPYEECGGQCNWELPGSFGLHGIASDSSKLAVENAGSSGCVRHSEEDITYLFNMLDLEKGPIRYYIKDI